MAVNKIYKFRDVNEAKFFLNGAISGAQLFEKLPAIVRSIVGTTITLKSPGPSGSHTFTAAASPPDNDGTALYFADIKSQLEAAFAGLLVTMQGLKFTLSESTPTNGVTVAATAYGTHPQTVGSVDINTLTFGAGGSLDTKTLVLKHDGGGNLSVTFVAPANRQAVLDQINAVTTTNITASLSGTGHLVLTAPTSEIGPSHNVQVVSGTSLATLGLTAATYAGLATNTANTLLGFDTNKDSVGKLYKPSVITTTPPVWIWADTNNENMHVIYTWE